MSGNKRVSQLIQHSGADSGAKPIDVDDIQIDTSSPFKAARMSVVNDVKPIYTAEKRTSIEAPPTNSIQIQEQQPATVGDVEVAAGDGVIFKNNNEEND